MKILFCKNILSLSLIVMILLSLLCFNVNAENDIICGDVNGDNRILAADARLALRFSANLETPSEKQKNSADVNRDGKITASDARRILRVSAQLDEIGSLTEESENSGVLTEEKIKQIFIKANNLYDGWLCHAWAPELDENDIIIVNDRLYARINSDEFSSVSELEDELKNYFTPEIYKYYSDSYYVMYNGKMYGAIELGQGGDIFPIKLGLTVNSMTEKECTFTVTSYYEYDEPYSVDYKIRMINGKWIFVEQFTENFGLYFDNDILWDL